LDASYEDCTGCTGGVWIVVPDSHVEKDDGIAPLFNGLDHQRIRSLWMHRSSRSDMDRRHDDADEDSSFSVGFSSS
jgi:hypothetical protein